MRLAYFRLVVGVSVILTHGLSFAIIFFWKDAYLSMSQKIDMALIIMPITAAYAVGVVRSALERGNEISKGPKMNLNYSIVVISVTLMSMTGLLFTVLGISGGTQDDRRQVQVFEIAFGALFGLIASELFASKGNRKNSTIK